MELLSLLVCVRICKMRRCTLVKILIYSLAVFQISSLVFAQPLDSNLKCGKTLVPYGTTDQRVSAPWTAILFQRTTQSNGIHEDWISGVIVGPSTVLTRGRQFWEAGQHNGKRGPPRMKGFKPENILVGVGVFNRKSFQLDSFAQIFEVEYIRPHPKSYLEHSEYDFAMVQLKDSISMSTKVHPICVEPTSSATFTKTYDFSSTFLRAPKRLSGYHHWANYTVHASRYKLLPSDVCDSLCQTIASPSSEGQFENGGPPCPPKPRRPAQQDEFEDFFLVGASLASWLNNRWHLAGIVTKTYGCNSRFKHFVSLIATKGNLAWINGNIQNAGKKYTCMDGTGIDTRFLCNGRVDCLQDGGSDEESSYCEALNCPAGALKGKVCNTPTDGAIMVRNGANSVITIKGPVQVQGQVQQQRPPATRPTRAPTTPAPVQAPISTTTRTPPLIAFPETIRTTRPVPQSPTGERMCPPILLTAKEKEGIRFQCTGPRSSIPLNGRDCSDKPHPSGTKILQTCRPHYKSGSRISFSEMTCGEDGNWVRAGAYFTCAVECGVAKTPLTGHIVNGTVTESSNWPWNAALFVKKNNEFLYICGATLITSRSLVTAAHCVDTVENKLDDIRVVLAPISSKFPVNQNYPYSQIMQIERIHLSERYAPGHYDADIAIVKTTTRVQINNHVYPACFPFPGRENEQIERFQTSSGSIGLVVGFGTDESFALSETLKAVRLPVVSDRECSKVLDIFPAVTQLCAGYTTGVSVCNGDSGAGLLFQEEDARKLYFLQAIVSHGQSGDDPRLCDYNRYSIFIRVGAFKEWIERLVATD